MIAGSCSFLALPKPTSVLASVPSASHVTIELTVDYLDHASYDVIAEWTRQHQSNGGTVTGEELGSAGMASAAMEPPPRSTRTADSLNGHLDDQRDEQQPESLFLTCSDSRIVPNIITSSGPGDLFTVRNVGNLVPPDQGDASVEAALAFALDQLGVSSMIVCGHSGCGAMKALLADADRPDPLSPGHHAIAEWLEQAQPSKRAFLSGHPVARSAAEAGFNDTDQLGIVNVALQIETLERHPLVGDAVATGQVHLVGLFFDLASARVLRVSSTGVSEFDVAEVGA